MLSIIDAAIDAATALPTRRFTHSRIRTIACSSLLRRLTCDVAMRIRFYIHYWLRKKTIQADRLVGSLSSRSHPVSSSTPCC